MNFIDYASVHGLQIDRLRGDNCWHRVKTSDKPHKRNGCYIFDGSRGALKNWATMESFATWPDRDSYEPVDWAKVEAARKKSEVETANKHSAAAKAAGELLRQCVLEKHQYLDKKGFPDALGLVLDGKLLIPMRDYRTNTLSSVQSIGDDKKFMYGGRTKGSVFVIGKKTQTCQKWFVEGYATGLSVAAALNEMKRTAEVWVCFSASNLEYVATRVGGERYVVADNDASMVGQKAAESTQLPWVMPPEGDANDYHQSAGIWKLVSLLRPLKYV